MDKFITSDKILYHPDTLDAWRHNKIIYPVTFEIHPSNRCNNNCYYCYADRFRDGTMMAKKDMHKAILKLFHMKIKGLIFSGGGEPLCNPDTIEAVCYAKKIGLSVGFITNGILINKAIAGAMVKNCEWVRVSIDSLNPTTYKKIRGMEGVDCAKKGIIILLKEKKRLKSPCVIGVQSVVNKYNFNEIALFVKEVERKFIGIDYIQIRPLEIMQKRAPYSPKKIAEIKKQLFMVRKNSFSKHVIISTKWDLIFGRRECGYIACHCYGMIGAIDAHGDIYICCHMAGIPRFKYGNIFHSTIRAIFHRREIVARNTIKYHISHLCPIGCRGSSINRRLEGLLRGVKHKNFL